MRRGLLILGTVAVGVFVAALLVMRDGPRTPTSDPVVSAPQRSPQPHAAPSRPTPNATSRRSKPETSEQPGLKLGKHSGPEARAKAQAILDDALTELQRMDGSQPALAREVYMRGHSAAERVEDELDPDDEPGLAELRAHEDAMKAELRRIYGAP